MKKPKKEELVKMIAEWEISGLDITDLINLVMETTSSSLRKWTRTELLYKAKDVGLVDDEVQ